MYNPIIVRDGDSYFRGRNRTPSWSTDPNEAYVFASTASAKSGGPRPYRWNVETQKSDPIGTLEYVRVNIVPLITNAD